MSAQDNGGPAFPTSNGGSPDDGMTLRDYFAAKAMQALLIAALPTARATHEVEACLSNAAFCCWDVADAMLNEREA